MSHPIFDAPSYPWHRPEAVRLHQVLYQAVTNPNRIDTLYKSSGQNLPPLALNTSPDEIWKQALEKLTTSGALQRLCQRLQNTGDLQNETIQRAIDDVINAEPAVVKQVLSDSVLVLDRMVLRGQLEKLESDDDPIKVILVRGGPASGKSHGRYLFERMAKDRGAIAVYLCDGIVATVDELVEELFSNLGALEEVPERLTTESAWYRKVCVKLKEVAMAKETPMWIAVDDLGPAPDGGPLLDTAIREFCEQFALNMMNPAFRQWFRLMLIHYPDTPVPTRWKRDFWTEDRTDSADIKAEHIQAFLRSMLEKRSLTILDDELAKEANLVIMNADSHSDEQVPRLRLIHDALVEKLASLGSVP